MPKSTSGSPLSTEIPSESGKAKGRNSSRIRTSKPTRQRQSAVTGIPDDMVPTLCACGCLESFTPRRNGGSPQRFLPGHRYRTYSTHRCPDCGVVHRQAVTGGTKE